jgi:hypothetical protein
VVIPSTLGKNLFVLMYCPNVNLRISCRTLLRTLKFFCNLDKGWSTKVHFILTIQNRPSNTPRQTVIACHSDIDYFFAMFITDVCYWFLLRIKKCDLCIIIWFVIYFSTYSLDVQRNKLMTLTARNGNLEVPLYILKAKQGCTVKKKKGKR